MRDDDYSFLVVAADVVQKFQYSFARFVVQSAGRFVAEEQFGIFGYRPCDRHPLLFAARELRGEVLHSVGKADLLERLGRVERVFAYLGSYLHVLERGQILNKVIELEYKTHVVAAVFGELFFLEVAYLHSVYDNFAGGDAVHTAEHV